MKLKRKQLFEFEDQSWFPNEARKGLTQLIILFNKLMKVDQALSNAIMPLIKRGEVFSIVDLGSGSGGAMPMVLNRLQSKTEEEIKLTLSDLYPNLSAKQRLERENEQISYLAEPLSASNFEKAPDGIKTMVNCFHHMPVTTAKEILRKAQETKQTLVIYEVGYQNIPFPVWLVLLPISLALLVLMSLVMTLFVRPVRPMQILLTYIIPLIPIAYAWDGQASLPRTYSEDDLKELTKDLPAEKDYKWEYTLAKDDTGKTKGYTFIGRPT